MTLSIDDIEPASHEIWHPYWQWEEVGHNMWGSVVSRKTWVEIARVFTADHDLYGYWMMKVVTDWASSCEQSLTKSGDKRPWIGHAAVAYAIGCPEDIVREAWGLLTEDQQIKANQKAAEAIEYWKNKNAKENT